MQPDQAKKTAEAIVDDLRGAAYYRDPKVLASFLQIQFGGSAARASEVADAVVDDLRGAAYYRDAEVLAEFLGGKFREPA
jgi:hypothetical protein